jgi:hypothetical protein
MVNKRVWLLALFASLFVLAGCSASPVTKSVTAAPVHLDGTYCAGSLYAADSYLLDPITVKRTGGVYTLVNNIPPQLNGATLGGPLNQSALVMSVWQGMLNQTPFTIEASGDFETNEPASDLAADTSVQQLIANGPIAYKWELYGAKYSSGICQGGYWAPVSNLVGNSEPGAAYGPDLWIWPSNS